MAFNGCPTNESDPFGLAAAWQPHNPAQNDYISKLVHFNAGDPNKTELGVRVGADGRVYFERIFGKDEDRDVNRAIQMSEEKLANDPEWRAKLQTTAKEAKSTLFDWGYLDKAREVKKLEKALKLLNNRGC